MNWTWRNLCDHFIQEEELCGAHVWQNHVQYHTTSSQIIQYWLWLKLGPDINLSCKMTRSYSRHMKHVPQFCIRQRFAQYQLSLSTFLLDDLYVRFCFELFTNLRSHYTSESRLQTGLSKVSSRWVMVSSQFDLFQKLSNLNIGHHQTFCLCYSGSQTVRSTLTTIRTTKKLHSNLSFQTHPNFAELGSLCFNHL